MATTNYQFPTITAEDTINGVTAINNLADAVDSALKEVDDKASGGEAYVLPPATTSKLGGVIIGDNLSVDGSGRISAPAGQTYVLPAATTSALGGVIVGTGLSVDGSGNLSVNSTWLTQQINTAVAAYMSSHYTTGTTWGQINANGFLFPND
nr:MAG TPA: hypothetical protein [Caudoviricetes sp.]